MIVAGRWGVLGFWVLEAGPLVLTSDQCLFADVCQTDFSPRRFGPALRRPGERKR